MKYTTLIVFSAAGAVGFFIGNKIQEKRLDKLRKEKAYLEEGSKMLKLLCREFLVEMVKTKE